MSTTTEHAGTPGTAPSTRHLHHWWDGAPRSATGVRSLRRLDPATDLEVGTVPCAAAEEIAEAVGAARGAASAWASTAADARAAALRDAADRVEANRHELARRQTVEMGKPIADAEGGVDAAIGTIRQFAELGPLHGGRTLQGDPAAIDFISHVPRGVAAVITPWNDPVAIAAQGIAANLAVGNTVVCKPSERASFSVAELFEAFDHLPTGVCNLVLGDGSAGAHLVDDDVDVVVFTGSVRAGRRVAERCAPRFVHPVLELGGNDALIVDDGVDPCWAAEQIATGAFANAGQICVAAERVFVHRAIAEPVIEELAALARAHTVGSGLEPGTTLGPLVDHDHLHHVHEHVTDAVARGATLRAGGEPMDGPGAFYPATVLADVPDGCRVLDEETFGPVAPVVTVGDFEEALERAASGEHGLAATVLTADQHHAQTAWRRLPVGTVKVNAVFGGAPGGSADPHGSSGTGLGYGPGLLDELTRQRMVHLGATPSASR